MFNSGLSVFIKELLLLLLAFSKQHLAIANSYNANPAAHVIRTMFLSQVSSIGIDLLCKKFVFTQVGLGPSDPISPVKDGFPCFVSNRSCGISISISCSISISSSSSGICRRYGILCRITRR